MWVYVFDVLLAAGLVGMFAAFSRKRRNRTTGWAGWLLLLAFVGLGILAIGFAIWLWTQAFAMTSKWRYMLVGGVCAVALAYVYWMVIGKRVWKIARA